MKPILFLTVLLVAAVSHAESQVCYQTSSLDQLNPKTGVLCLSDESNEEFLNSLNATTTDSQLEYPVKNQANQVVGFIKKWGPHVLFKRFVLPADDLPEATYTYAHTNTFVVGARVTIPFGN